MKGMIMMKMIISEFAEDRLAMSDLPGVLTVKDVQQVLGVGRISVYNLIEAGRLRAFKMGRVYKIPKGAVIEFLKDERKGDVI